MCTCTVHSGRCYFILTDRGNRVENETAGSQKKTHSKHPEELPKAQYEANSIQAGPNPTTRGTPVALGDRSAGTETCGRKERNEKDGERTEQGKEVLDKNKIRERDRGQEGAEGSRRMYAE